jgi:Protein of unknown function (DUF3604)
MTVPGSYSHHGHGHGCVADHHRGEYTERQRADLALVLAFNHRLADAVDECIDITDTIATLDPDPLRYMWVDEGDGQIPAQLGKAGAVLDHALRLAGQHRGTARPVEASRNAARPSLAAHGGTRLVSWLEWQEGRGDRLLAELTIAGSGRVAVVVEGPEDLFRPTAAVTTDGTPWLLFGRSVDGVVGVWASRFAGGGWSGPELVSGTDGPSFNQEVCPHPDGSLQVCWQGRVGDRFGVFARRFAGGGWQPPVWVSEGVEHNVWDPTLAATPDGMAYAWAEYTGGSYAVALRRIGAGGGPGPVRRLTGGTDYALHPSLASTTDGRLWCAFDVITVHGHGGSGPTRLRRRPEPGQRIAEQEGMREPGASVPPELLPEVSAGIRVVCIAGDELVEPPGELAPGLNVTPSAMPRLQATVDGGLVVGYRIHRQLPLMTYYWEAAVQVLGPAGWRPPSTFAGTDATLEEVSLAATATGVVLATQSDGRLVRALDWTEGFGGRECPYLADHHGAVIWHGVHGAGQVVLAALESAGPAAPDTAPGGRRARMLQSDERQEARRWAAAEPQPRYRVHSDGADYQLYWGDLHRHSLVSRCTSGDEPSLEDFYRYAWDVNSYDFWAVTDHAENSTAYQWWSIQKIADLLHVPGRFVPLYGFEWTSADSGHQNVIYGDVARGAPIFSAFAEGSTTPDGLWRGLAEHPEFPAITIPHHPGSAMVHNDWDYHDPRYSRLVEVFQACRGNYESQSSFRQYSDATATGTFMIDGLRRGHRFGLIASSDHGHGASYVAVLARSLSRADIFDGLYSRRTCAATTRGVVADLRLGSHLMGAEVECSGPRPLRLHAAGYTELARIDLLRDGELLHTWRGEPPPVPGELRVDLRVEWGQATITTVWDGRLWVEGGRLLLPEFVGPEVVAMDAHSVAWEHVTHSFGEPYGAQRGGVEVSVVGPGDAVVHIGCGGRSIRIGLAELADRLSTGAFTPESTTVLGLPGELFLQPAVGALLGLGRSELEVSFDDDTELDSGAAFYYARVFQVDGELAWSSPIWVDPG